ncbi:MAG: choice-of-anchor J domain-containing protein [Bacteroidetes bacterium]|nr:choice-of-anchor J domain-containing protein [Bacteroidota bacterium]
MNSFSYKIVGLLITVFFVQIALGQNERPSRSGHPSDLESLKNLRRFPCGGNVILDQRFNADSIPGDWLTYDLDTLSPRSEILFLTGKKGWQSVIDFKDPDSTNRVLASASWYADTIGQSDDYLVSPKVMVPNNACLSWYAYSQDKFFPESYEIRISTTTPDPAGFLQNPPVLTVEAEGDEFTYRSINLSDYGGQEVYIAFRHTSLDKFILALDDIRLAEVEVFDIALRKIEPIITKNLLPTEIVGSIINAGLDTVSFDSTNNMLIVHYQIDEEEVNTDTLYRTLTLVPNDTVAFVHDSLWYPGIKTLYKLKVWISGFGTDDNVVNDTIGRWQGVGVQTNIEKQLSEDLISVYPNPFDQRINLEFSSQLGANQVELDVFDLSGRRILRMNAVSTLRRQEIDLGSLEGGVYILKVTHPDGRIYSHKILRR